LKKSTRATDPNHNPEVLKNVPLFSLLDDDSRAVPGGQVELKTFAAGRAIAMGGDRV